MIPGLKALIFMCALLAASTPAGAAESAVPVESPGGRITYLELFSSPSCPFCPAAERNLADVLAAGGVIGVTCVVDYFDTGQKDTLARPFCAGRQDVYVHMLRTGARYTPQLVIDGRVQLPGQDLQKLSAALKAEQAAPDRPLALMITPDPAKGGYDVVLPPLAGKARAFVLRLTMVETAPAPDSLPAAMPPRTPHNVATAMAEGGIWDGKQTVWTVKPPAGAKGDAFIVTVQDQDSGKVLAAGFYKITP